MRIFVIPSWYPSKTKPNNGSFFREQAKVLITEGNEIVLLNGTFRSKEAYFTKENFKVMEYNDAGLITYQYVTPNFMLSRNAWLGIKMANHNINKIFKAAIAKYGYPDVIHAHSFYPAGYVACILGEKYNIPVVVTEHSSRVLKNNLSKQHRKYLCEVIERTDEFLCVSKRLLEVVEEITNNKGKGRVFYNIVSDKFKLGILEEKESFTFISVGNLIQSKRHDIIIDAFNKAFTTNDNVKLRIIGDGNLKDSLRTKVSKLNREHQIIFTGELSREAVVKEMQNSDAFIMASEFETFGIVYIEAMACGNPIITVKNGGSDSLINEENGIILEENSIDKFSNAMKYMIKNRKNYNSEDISMKCISKYGKNSYIKQTYELYNYLIHRKEEYTYDKK